MANTTDNLPAITNSALARYIEDVQERYPNAEFYKEKKRDSGRGEGSSLLITICENGSIEEEETFYYSGNSDLESDLETLDSYLEFS